MRLMYACLLLGLLSHLASTPVVAQTAAVTEPTAKRFVSQHETTCNGQLIRYKATAEERFLRNEKDELTASIWSVSYTKEEPKLAASKQASSGLNLPDAANRPVLFIFNGGPGSASVWLHLGLLGPKLVQVPSNADMDDGAAPYTLINNDLCLLDLTDLVFIDPVGTGYSRPIGVGKPADFWGLQEDAASITLFIRNWVTANNRWNAPKYIAGESFGTTRAALVAEMLNGSGQSMALNGLVLISQALDYTGSTPTPDNIISNITYLPTMAATAWYHRRAGQGLSLPDFVQQARLFATDEYLPALFKGNTLPAANKASLSGQLAYFTGLDSAYISRSGLRILASRFRKELLREQGLVVGGLDSRYTLDEPDDIADSPTMSDAASTSIASAYTAALNAYLNTDLDVRMDRPYLTSNDQIYPQWNWRTVPTGQAWEPSYVNTARSLSQALHLNKDLRVMVANGYYDMVTPFFDAEYTLARHDIPAGRIQMLYYEAGHMMYTRHEELAKLTADIRQFLTR